MGGEVLDGTTIDVSIKIPDRGFSTGNRHECSRLHDFVAKAPSTASRFDPILHKTDNRRAVRRSVPTPRAVAHLSTNVHKNHKKKSAATTPGPPQTVGGKQSSCRHGADLSSLSLCRGASASFYWCNVLERVFSNRTTGHAVFNSVGGTSFQPFVSDTRLAIRIPIVMIRMMATTSLTTTLMVWLMFENHCLASRTRASHPPPRLPLFALHPVSRLVIPWRLAGRKMERLAT